MVKYINSLMGVTVRRFSSTSKIRLRRGPDATKPNPDEGELIYATDAKKVYVGDGTAPILVGPVSTEDIGASPIGHTHTISEITGTPDNYILAPNDGEKYFKFTDANIDMGMYGSKSYLGLRDWKNNRNILRYDPAANVITLGSGSTISLDSNIMVKNNTKNLFLNSYNYFSISLYDGYTWLRNSTGNWTFQGGSLGDDFSKVFQCRLPSVDGNEGKNDTYVELGQSSSNLTNGSYRGIRVVKHANSAVVDGDIKAGAIFSTNKIYSIPYDDTKEVMLLDFDAAVPDKYGIGVGVGSTEGYLVYNSGTASSEVFGHRFRVGGVERLTIKGDGIIYANNEIRVSQKIYILGADGYKETVLLDLNSNLPNTYGIGMGVGSTEGYLVYSSGNNPTDNFGHRFRVNGTEMLRIEGDSKVKIFGRLVSTYTNPVLSNDSYCSGNLELRSGGSDYPTLGFHRPTYTAVALYHKGDAVDDFLRIRTVGGGDYELIHGGNIMNKTAGLGFRLQNCDGDRQNSILPTSNPRTIWATFESAETMRAGVPWSIGSFVGMITYTPWDGTTSSGGDSSYQLAFASSITNGGNPRLFLRNGIQSTWNAWNEIITNTNLDGYNEAITARQSLRDFTAGTLVKTSINYAVSAGDPFLLEITGNSYGNVTPFNVKIQGYIYNDTIINIGGVSCGTLIESMVAFCMDGVLCFWWPRQGYWHGFDVFASISRPASVKKNHVTAIFDTAKPTGITKEVAIGNVIKALSTADIVINTGDVASGGYVPLPAGFTQAQCKWIVTYSNIHNVVSSSTADHPLDFYCYTDANRLVTCCTYSKTTNGSDAWYTGTARYIIIGVK